MTTRCNICQEERCKPNAVLMKNLSYFSGITQRTLSAFHRAGIDASLLDEIDDIKSHLISPKPLVLIDAIPLDNGLYKRLFSDDYTDVVPYKEIFSNVYKKASDIDDLDVLADGTMSPISKMGSNIKLATIDTPRKTIDRPTEAIFFL
jgi:hypothetical protein